MANIFNMLRFLILELTTTIRIGDLRVKYLLNRIEEEEWKTTIQRREENMRKMKHFRF